MSIHGIPLSPEVVSVLADAEVFDWTAVSHAYWDAADVPAMLAALAAGQDVGPDSPVGDLWGSLYHQGTVYPASTAAVPFLARLAAAGAEAKECLLQLGAMAQSDDGLELSDPEEVRDAVRGQVGVLRPLAEHGQAEIRQATVFALGQTRSCDLAPLLGDVLAHDTEPVVRAEALMGLARCEHDVAALVASALDDPDDAVRLAGVVAALDAGRSWNDSMHEALLSVADPDGVSEHFCENLLDAWYGSFDWVVQMLCETGQGEAAARLLIDAAGSEVISLRTVLHSAPLVLDSPTIDGQSREALRQALAGR
ncbi:MAG: HEAT repeat domain-containing protein [Micrococcales bacterium]|nr:HEAT repeat domain-containing protein [Micrococcales bacterium]